MEPDPLAETNGRYTKIQSLGKGSFGFVQLASSNNGKTQEMVAVKLLKRGDVNKYVEGEIVNHSLLRHPHVIQVGTLTYMAPEVLVNRDGKYDGKMLDKMLNQRYSIPEAADTSAKGRDLLQRMLLPDPVHRIQLDQIRSHPWFLTNLPPEATTMNDSYLKAPFPAGYQRPEDIKQLLEEAKGVRHHYHAGLGPSSPGPMAGLGPHPSDSALIEDAIQEDLARHPHNAPPGLPDCLQQRTP
ncbi:protein kinase domain-containing protein [Haematococcus lacustris]|uniref:Protein kinase domain-containing protein n=1 Tax=Haematococcus lacustris TaxID=44745 RepID=A0A699YN12_HAELA|nr:protein kinase domain-containing protein [Haematococcus lacustris]